MSDALQILAGKRSLVDIFTRYLNLTDGMSRKRVDGGELLSRAWLRTGTNLRNALESYDTTEEIRHRNKAQPKTADRH